MVLYRAEVPGEEEYEAEYESLADALHFACRDLRAGRRVPLEIREDGAVVLTRDGIRERCRAELEEIHARLDTELDAEGNPAP
jgi:hypothetical protein